MLEFKIWDKEFPLFDSDINNEENDGINTMQFYGVESEAPAQTLTRGKLLRSFLTARASPQRWCSTEWHPTVIPHPCLMLSVL